MKKHLITARKCYVGKKSYYKIFTLYISLFRHLIMLLLPTILLSPYLMISSYFVTLTNYLIVSLSRYSYQLSSCLVIWLSHHLVASFYFCQCSCLIILSCYSCQLCCLIILFHYLMILSHYSYQLSCSLIILFRYSYHLSHFLITLITEKAFQFYKTVSHYYDKTSGH